MSKAVPPDWRRFFDMYETRRDEVTVYLVGGGKIGPGRVAMAPSNHLGFRRLRSRDSTWVFDPVAIAAVEVHLRERPGGSDGT